MNERKKNSGAKFKIVIALLTLAIIFVAVIYSLIIYELNAVKKATPNNAIFETPENFVYSYNIAVNSEEITIDGFAFVVGGNTYNIDNFIYLYCSTDNVYYKLPTKMNINEAANSVTGEKYNYSRSGFLSRANESAFDKPLENYEICFYYKNDDYNNIIHTGNVALEGDYYELTY